MSSLTTRLFRLSIDARARIFAGPRAKNQELIARRARLTRHSKETLAGTPESVDSQFQRTYNAASPQTFHAPSGSTGATMSLIKIIVITLAFILTILFFFGRLLF